MGNILFLIIILFSTTLNTKNVNADDCYNSSIVSPNPFLGNNDEVFKLEDGTYWEVGNEYEYLYEYLPNVTICPSQGNLIIKNKTLSVIQITDVVESRIDGEFKGWEGETIFKLTNGQIWQQSIYAYYYYYAYNPNVKIYNVDGIYRMKVDGVEDTINVKRIN